MSDKAYVIGGIEVRAVKHPDLAGTPCSKCAFYRRGHDRKCGIDIDDEGSQGLDCLLDSTYYERVTE